MCRASLKKVSDAMRAGGDGDFRDDGSAMSADTTGKRSSASTEFAVRPHAQARNCRMPHAQHSLKASARPLLAAAFDRAASNAATRRKWACVWRRVKDD